MIRKIAGFDWDGGNIGKCRKHGVPLADIEAVFIAGPDMAPDMKHSGAEHRDWKGQGGQTTICRLHLPRTKGRNIHSPHQRPLHA